METLTSKRIEHTRNDGVDKVTIQVQGENEQPSTPHETKGFILYNENFQWIGIEFSFKGKEFTLPLVPFRHIVHREEANFTIETNTYGIYEIECTHGVINGFGKAHPFAE